MVRRMSACLLVLAAACGESAPPPLTPPSSEAPPASHDAPVPSDAPATSAPQAQPPAPTPAPTATADASAPKTEWPCSPKPSVTAKQEQLLKQMESSGRDDLIEEASNVRRSLCDAMARLDGGPAPKPSAK